MTTYSANIVSYSYYDPCRMFLPRRHGEESDYRYGFQGQEMDDEIKGEGNSVNYKYRMHDPRIGRWLSRDPLESKYVSVSAYAFVANTPIQAYDPDGRLIIFVNGYCGTKDRTMLNTSGRPVFASMIPTCIPLKPYWTEALKSGFDYLGKAATFFNDNGSQKFVNGEGYGLSTAADRKNAGREYMTTARIQEFKDALGEGEEINIVAHSMGSAYAEGMIEVMMNDDVLAKALKSGEIIHFSPADATGIAISWNARSLLRTQINTTGDKTLDVADYWTSVQDRRIPGVTYFGVVNWSLAKYHPNAKEWDSHYDTKTFPMAFDWAEDLKGIKASFHHREDHLRTIGLYFDSGYRNYYSSTLGEHKTTFLTFQNKSNAQKYLHSKEGTCVTYRTKIIW